MFVLFLVLAVVSLICLVVGSGLALARYGQTQQRSGPDVGADIMGGQETGGRGVFAGKGFALGREVEISIPELVAAWRAGKHGEMLPFVIAIVGFEGTLIFGGIALLLGVDVKVFGWIVLATGLYGLWLMGSSLRKGE